MAKIPFEMPNLLNFPMSKLCYDLKLEAVEEMDTQDIVELMRTNKEFRSILIYRPWMIFGKHVDSIIFHPFYVIETKISPELSRMFDLRFEMAILKKIRHCSNFLINHANYSPTDEETKMISEMLACLDSIGEIRPAKNYETLCKELSMFKGSIVNRIYLDLSWYQWKGDDENYRFLLSLFQNRIKNCKEVWLRGRAEEVYFFRKFLWKTKVEMILFEVINEPLRRKCAEMLIRWIVTNGIPSQNRGAAIWLTFTNTDLKIFTNWPGIREVDEERKAKTWKMMLETLKNFSTAQNENDSSIKPIHYHVKSIDSERECIYIVYKHDNDPYLRFFAKNVPIEI